MRAEGIATVQVREWERASEGRGSPAMDPRGGEPL